MKNAVNWFEIYTTDFARAKQFYTTVFHAKLTEVPVDNGNHGQMQYALFSGSEENSGANGALVHLDIAKPGIGGTLVYFNCNDVNDQLKQVELAGGKIIRAKQAVGNLGFIALVEDTEGNMIGLRSLQ